MGIQSSGPAGFGQGSIDAQPPNSGWPIAPTQVAEEPIRMPSMHGDVEPVGAQVTSTPTREFPWHGLLAASK